MSLFDVGLSKVEQGIKENFYRTKQIFPEEIQHIEYGLTLLWDFTQHTNDSEKDFPTKPDLLTNRNLFGRNRQLLLNAYFCMLSSNYGTQFVILRTVLENNNLMRLFHLHPIYAFEWLPKEKQMEFSPEFRSTFTCLIEKRRFDPYWVLKNILGEETQKKAKKDIARIYGQLCDYTHPNYKGWQEIMGSRGTEELLLELPTFSDENAEHAVGIMLYLVQLSFKTFVETFDGYWTSHAYQLMEWQIKFKKIMTKYIR